MCYAAQLANPTAQSESSHTISRPILHRAGTTSLFVLANGAFLTRGAARKTLRDSLRDLGLMIGHYTHWLALASGIHLAPRHSTGSPQPAGSVSHQAHIACRTLPSTIMAQVHAGPAAQ